MTAMHKWMTSLFFVADLIIAVSIFLAPLTLRPGTVVSLHGGANRVDYDWGYLPPYQRIVYWWGDLNCHQWSERSFYINGNQMPQCARDVGIYSGSTLGLGVALLVPTSSDFTGTLSMLFPRRVRKAPRKTQIIVLAVTGALLILPTVVDGTIQMFTSYESTNIMRVVTGALAGAGAGLFFGIFMNVSLQTIHSGTGGRATVTHNLHTIRKGEPSIDEAERGIE